MNLWNSLDGSKSVSKKYVLNSRMSMDDNGHFSIIFRSIIQWMDDRSDLAIDDHDDDASNSDNSDDEAVSDNDYNMGEEVVLPY